MSDSVRVICLSDIHAEWDRIEVPEGDILVVAGDLCDDDPKDVLAARHWFATMQHATKLYVCGNHDDAAIAWPGIYPMLDVLVDRQIEANGLRIYGAPWDSEGRFGWEFKIPDSLDILITHEPPYRILDWSDRGGSRDGNRLGNRDLLTVIKRVMPRIHIFGHCHQPYGNQQIGDTIFANVAICDRQYQAAHPVTVIDITDEDITVNQWHGTRYARKRT
jgi:predicted phosphodiesterase